MKDEKEDRGQTIHPSSFIPHPFPRRPCPVCDGSERHILYRQRFFPLSQGTLLEAYDVTVCSGCGFGFADNIPDQATFDAYYREMSKYGYQHQGGVEHDWVLKRFKETADILRPFLPSPRARILDVGCANGGLLGQLRKEGYANVLGFDPSPSSTEAAERLYGVRVLTRTLSDLGRETARHDLIILGGVLEHVREVNQALADLERMLEPGGYLYLEVPDATAFADHRNAPFQEFSLEHVNFFSPTSLRNLLARHGFTLEKCICEPRELSWDALEPCILAVFRKTGAPLSLAADQTTLPALTRYVRQCQQVEDRVLRIIGELAERGRPIIVWGVGTHTLRLLGSSRLGQMPIAAFVDSNPNFAGKQLRGVDIVSPDTLKDGSEPILISSWVYQREIERTIREKLRLANDVICLYEMEP